MAETYQIAGRFSSVAEYRWFKEKYCENGCVQHKEKEDGFPALVEDGGCPLEDQIEWARYGEKFPSMLLSVWDGEKCLKWYHCPFYRRGDDG